MSGLRELEERVGRLEEMRMRKKAGSGVSKKMRAEILFMLKLKGKVRGMREDIPMDVTEELDPVEVKVVSIGYGMGAREYDALVVVSRGVEKVLGVYGKGDFLELREDLKRIKVTLGLEK